MAREASATFAPCEHPQIKDWYTDNQARISSLKL